LELQKISYTIDIITTPHEQTHNKYNPEIAIKALTLAKRAFKLSRKKLSNTIPDKLEKLVALGLADKRPQHLSIEDWMELLDI